MADSYAPVYELNNGPTKVAAAYMIDGQLNRWYNQPFLPIANNAVGKWLMEQVGYVPPAPYRVIYPPSSGRGYPREP